MSIQDQLRRGTTSEHSIFTGAEGELTHDTTLNAVVVHDGSNPGGKVVGSVQATLTALSDANATLTAAQMVGSLFTITPTAARVLTTDSASNIITALPFFVDDDTFEIVIINLAGSNVTLNGGASVSVVGDNTITGCSATFIVRRLTSSTVAMYRKSSQVSKGYMHVRDEKSVGSEGGASSVGVNIRVLNTVVTNTIAGASLATNQITLPAGTYRINASLPSYEADRTRGYVYSVTSAALLLGGVSNASDSTNNVGIISPVAGRIVLTATTVLELRHFYQSAKTSNGLGLGSNLAAAGVEVFADIEIEQIL